MKYFVLKKIFYKILKSIVTKKPSANRSAPASSLDVDDYVFF
jgi:hypothetical protein